MRSSRRWVMVGCGLGVVLLLLLPMSRGTAHAGGVALESSAGPRAKAAAAALAPILEELGKRGYPGGYDAVGRAFEKSVSRPSQIGAGLPGDFVERVDQAYRLWITGEFKAGLAALGPLVEQAHRNPASVIGNPRFGAALFKAHVGLAMCHHRLGDDTEAWAAMAELLRSSDLEVTKGQYGAEAFGLYQQVKKEAKATATGGLSVRAADATAAIYVNERFAKIGEYTRADLIPGTYRVVAQLGPDFGRAYVVEVKAGGKADLVVDPAFERALVTSPEWTGLAFRDRAEREQREVEVAARFGAAAGELGVVVVGVDTRKDRAIAYGALVNTTTGKEIRRASVVIDTLPPPARLQALARFLVGEPTPLDGVEVHKVVTRPRPQLDASGGSVVVAEPAPSRFTPRRKVALGVAGLGVIGGVVGAVLWQQGKGFQDDADKLCPQRIGCPSADQADALSRRGTTRSRYAVATWAAGGVALVGAAVLWFTGAPQEDAEHTAIAPRLQPGFAGIDVIGRF